MAHDASVIVLGLAVDDPKPIYGTTRGLAAKFGSDRVFNTPLSEEAMTGVAIGAAMAGRRALDSLRREGRLDPVDPRRQPGNVRRAPAPVLSRGCRARDVVHRPAG